jgi:GNAT superfamily N-acetyltransferase
MEITIRLYQSSDFENVVILWRISREISVPAFQRKKGHFFYEDMAYFRDHILADDTVWVAVDSTGHPVAFMALKEDFIDHLYVHPDVWRKDLGEQMLAHARTISPRHLWLYTLQINLNARAFYEKNGFKAVQFGISPAPESEPDVKYEWSSEG